MFDLNPTSKADAVCDGVLDAIGNTPLVRFDRYLENKDVDLLVKLESGNPGGSAKDRPAKNMIDVALAKRQINPETTIIESSSGNMGIGLAQACRYHSMPFICVVDPRAQQQNLRMIQALGGTIEMVDKPIAGDFLKARLARVCQLLEQIPNCFWPNQYANSANPEAHFHGTIAEIDRALDGNYDALFVATSSTGTIQGCQEYLRMRGRRVKVYAVDACGSVLFGGVSGTRQIPGLGAGRVPPLARSTNVDRVIRVNDLQCVVGCRRAAAREAVLVGGSAGGVLEAVRQVSSRLRHQRCVAVLHDSGSRYLDTVFNDDWVKEHLQCSTERLQHLIDQDQTASQGFREEIQV
ncbi:2,3-diaminopropionate biosynthesis protein SbnA [Stieleria sp. JC731]|uniref:2,3-diaminopropionate biosynthesis protein SbnA n=1 Tax=Pirellulaceae TaxID=2691357 RepID=UPI001E42259B|nr:2,3-diaminopropionate biosynthesis protein SbnA [Stieleria sp. JC731]MCC9600458.1 2,3-diaminopropionate biosynthesis protein SbnA [Stieleria sp. JC731]